MKLLRVDLENHPTTASYAAKMKDVVADLKDLNIEILVVHILGLLMQIHLNDSVRIQPHARCGVSLCRSKSSSSTQLPVSQDL